jgi:hypothetical protein
MVRRFGSAVNAANARRRFPACENAKLVKGFASAKMI